MSRWEHFPHGADVGVRGIGATKAEAFEQAALALIAVMADVATIEAREARPVECEAPDDELLLVEWLNAIVYLVAADKMLFSRFSVEIDGPRLEAQAWGERLDPPRHRPAVEIKGATYTMLRVAREGDSWIAQTVVDV
ncbi:MAG TPA: archease [Steroidobacteraceae bacterium]|nr:archease [Steroidobacteraceae bacterium]